MLRRGVPDRHAHGGPLEDLPHLEQLRQELRDSGRTITPRRGTFTAMPMPMSICRASRTGTRETWNISAIRSWMRGWPGFSSAS